MKFIQTEREALKRKQQEDFNKHCNPKIPKTVLKSQEKIPVPIHSSIGTPICLENAPLQLSLSARNLLSQLNRLENERPIELVRLEAFPIFRYSNSKLLAHSSLNSCFTEWFNCWPREQ